MSSTPESLFDELAALPEGRSLPPVADWHPERSGRIDITIDSHGNWHHEGAPIRRPAMVKLFSTILRHDEDGYCLVTPAERLLIEVEDVPFAAVELAVRGAGLASELLFRTNVDDYVLAGPQHALWVEDPLDNPRPYIRVRGGLNARLNRAVFYQLVDLSQVVDGAHCVYSDGERFVLGPA